MDFHFGVKCWTFSKFLCWSLTLRKNSTNRNLTLEKHFIILIDNKKDKLLYTYKDFKSYFFYAFDTIMKLFFTIVYIRKITLTLIFYDHPLVEYHLWLFLNFVKAVLPFLFSSSHQNVASFPSLTCKSSISP